MDAVNNPISLTNLYPSRRGATTASAGSANTPSDMRDPNAETVAVTPIEMNFVSMLGESPVFAWIGITVLLLAGMWLATRFGGSRPAANARLSIYNIIAIPVLAIVGGSIAKVIAARWRLPFGISTIILAS